jgi:hypothetical protein
MTVTLDQLQTTIDEVLSEYSTDDEYLNPNSVYFDLAWFYHAGLDAAGDDEVSNDVVDTFMDASEGWYSKDIDDLGEQFENYYLTGFHGAPKVGAY